MQHVPNCWDIIIITQDGGGDIRSLALAFGVLAYGTRTQKRRHCLGSVRWYLSEDGSWHGMGCSLVSRMRFPCRCRLARVFLPSSWAIHGELKLTYWVALSRPREAHMEAGRKSNALTGTRSGLTARVKLRQTRHIGGYAAYRSLDIITSKLRTTRTSCIRD